MFDRDRSITCEMVARAELYGFKALVLTVDTPTFGIRFADLRNKFKLPPYLRFELIVLESDVAIRYDQADIVNKFGSGLSN